MLLKTIHCIDYQSTKTTNNLIQKYELILKIFRGISIADNFYFKPISPKLSDL